MQRPRLRLPALHEVQQVFVEDLFLVICQVHELFVDHVLLIVGHVHAQLFKAAEETVPPRMTSQPDGLGILPDVFGPHDFVRLAATQYAVLMNPGLVAERIAPHDGLVRRHGETRGNRHELAALGQEPRVDLRGEPEMLLPDLERHHDFFERSIAGPLADAVDGTLDLPRPGPHTGE